MLLEHCTWSEVERYLARKTGILIPIGSVEQHGPTGLMGTDILCAQSIAAAVGEALGVMVAPPIPVGLAEHHMGFAGSMTLQKDTLVAVIRDYVASLRRHGFRRFYFVNGHGGNIVTLNETLKALDAAEQGNDVARHTFVNWWAGPRTKALRDAWFGSGEGIHATPSEISVTQFVEPAASRPQQAIPQAPKSQSFSTAEDYRAKFPDGRAGADTTLATPEAGRRLIDAAVADIAEHYAAFAA